MIISSPHSAEDFKNYFYLRWKLLRSHWNEPPGSEQDEDEDSSYHVMVKDEERIVGIARLQGIEPGLAQIRYMAVDDDYQGKGIGRMIMQHLEDYARKTNIDEIFLHARENAVPFYEKLGYRLMEKSYVLFDCIQHYKMNKRL